MPPFGPVGRRELIAALRALGFSGPHRGGRHEFMQRGSVTVILPNPHGTDIGAGLLKRLLRQAGVSKREWEEV
jgi:predicted RNA binding protein YcfA (HicA-like mRNA interferase family)